MFEKRMTAAERRQQIMAVAAEEFAQHGLHGVSAEVIARRAGISQAYIFRLFGTKKHLFILVAVESFNLMTDAMLTKVGNLSGPEAIMVMGEEYRSKLADRQRLLLQMQAFAACGDREVRDAVRVAFGRLWNTVTKTSRVDPLRIKVFMALGMLLNCSTAMDVHSINEPWAAACAAPVPIDLFK